MIEYGPKISSNGLVLALDAINSKSYSGTGTNWHNLSLGSGDATISSVSFTSGSTAFLSFTGANFCSILTNPIGLTGDCNFSVIGWFKANGLWTLGSTWGIGGGTIANNINSYSNATQNEIAIDLYGTSTFGTGLTYSSTSWQHIAWIKTAGVFSRSNISIYVNGVQYTGAGLSVLRGNESTSVLITDGIVIGRADITDNNYYSKIDVSNFYVYSRILSTSEIIQNYNALKTRFNLL